MAQTLGNVWAKDHVADALKLLKKLAADGNKRVQTAVAGSLKELARKNPDAVKQAVIQWSKDKHADVRAVVQLFSRQDAKTQRKQDSAFLASWREVL